MQLAWAVVVAQLVERSIPIPEVRGSNPVIGNKLFILNICFLSTVYWKDKNKEKEKEAGNGSFFEQCNWSKEIPQKTAKKAKVFTK